MNIFLIILLNTVQFTYQCRINVKYESSWPSPNVKFGQLSAVSVDSNGNVYVFHRGTHIWDFTSFAYNNTYLKINEGPIDVDTVIVLNKTTGNYVNSWGHGLFYMPHGLTVDHENNVWLTDVALHQVFKYDRYGKHFFTLGEKFINGKDDGHFCKPTSVAVLSNGDFFVADGYCNSRIMKFSPNGSFLTKWGTSNIISIPLEKQPFYSFNIPHSLTLIESSNQICAADRENGRILCFNFFSGVFESEYKFLNITGTRIFSAAYSPVNGGLFYVVNGPAINDLYEVPVSGFAISVSKNTINDFKPTNVYFSNPHDLAVSKDGSNLYVVELNPYKIHKFNINIEKCNDKNETNQPVYRNANVTVAAVVIFLFITVLLVLICKAFSKGKRKYKNVNFLQQHHDESSESVHAQLM